MHADEGRVATGLPGHFADCPRYIAGDLYVTDWCDCGQRREAGEVPPEPMPGRSPSERTDWSVCQRCHHYSDLHGVSKPGFPCACCDAMTAPARESS